jgi:surface protein
MATITAEAKLYTGIRCWCVDKNISAALTSSFSIGNYNRPIQPADEFVLSSGALVQRLKRTVADVECVAGITLTDERYKTYGGGNNVITAGSPRVINNTNNWKLISSVICDFPTYIEIDVEKLQLPEGTDVILNFEEGWVLEDRGRQLPSGAWEYPTAIQGSPSPKQDNFISFRTPWYGLSFMNSSFSLPNTVLRIKQLASSLSSAASFTALPIFNPGKLAALFGGVFLTIPNAVKTVSAGATLFNSFGPLNVGGTPVLLTALRIKQLASICDTVFALTSDAIKYKTPGTVLISTTATISALVDRNIGPITSLVANAATMNIVAVKTARSNPAITATSSASASSIVTLGLIQNISAVSSLSITVSIPMVLETTGSQISIPILYGSVNCVISWGDGTETVVTSPNANWINKTYSSPYGLGVTKQIRIAGYVQHYGYQTQANIPTGSTGYNFPSSGNNIIIKTYANQSQTITKIVSFGDLGTESFVGAFINARYLTSVPTRLPSTVTNISRMFWHSIADDQFQNISNVGSWNVSNVTQMEGTFIRNRNGFNPAIGGWNVSNVTNMRDLFVFCDSGFNPNISSWDTGNVVSFNRTFYNASNFNQNIGSWDTGSATDMTGMFENAFVFNQDLTGWCVTNIPTAPANFANTASLPSGKWPIWGTCP